MFHVEGSMKLVVFLAIIGLVLSAANGPQSEFFPHQIYFETDDDKNDGNQYKVVVRGILDFTIK
ncbi:hypothetical protein B566_EDAN009820, partial [Ephemera danica]